MALRRWLGDALLSAGLVTREQLDEAVGVQNATGQKLGQALVSLGYLSESALLKAMCTDAGIPFADGDEIAPAPDVTAMIAVDVARQHGAVAIRLEGRHLVVAMADPFDLLSIRALTRAAGRSVRVMGAKREAVLAAIARVYASGTSAAESVAVAAVGGAAGVPAPRLELSRGGDAQRARVPLGVVQSVEDSATAIAALDEIVRRGVEMLATDIHIEPIETGVHVRYRVDGLLTDGGSFPKSAQSGVIGRVKNLASLDVGDSRLPQDGRARLTIAGRHVDLRVSTFPTLHGEDVVLRVLDRGRVALQLDKLGIESDDVVLFRTALRRSHGLVPVTGPARSGKTTTLYAALGEFSAGDHAIVTLEDPIEYEMPNVRQSQVNARAGLTFAAGLRSIMRHDPDIVLVGEMQDQETAQGALSAALAGHLVLTTLDTPTAAGTIPRLLDMGADPFMIASTVTMFVSQRLVRVLCDQCKARVDMPTAVRRRFELEDAVIYMAKGCDACRRTGYRGRIGIFEMLPMSPDIVAAIQQRTAPEQILHDSGRPTLLQDGLRKVRAGVTTLDEVLRVTG